MSVRYAAVHDSYNRLTGHETSSSASVWLTMRMRWVQIPETGKGRAQEVYRGPQGSEVYRGGEGNILAILHTMRRHFWQERKCADGMSSIFTLARAISKPIQTSSLLLLLLLPAMMPLTFPTLPIWHSIQSEKHSKSSPRKLKSNWHAYKQSIIKSLSRNKRF